MQTEETHLPAWMDAWNHVRDLAQARGMYFGAGARAGQLQQDHNYRLTRRSRSEIWRQIP